MVNIKFNVYRILKHIPEARNCDYTLYIEYLKKFHSDLIEGHSILLENIRLAPKMDEIVRYRRIYAKYEETKPTDPKVEHYRRRKQIAILNTL